MGGLCPSYEQALAVHLVLALGQDAAHAWDEASKLSQQLEWMSELRVAEENGAGEALGLKRLALLIHPDKTSHPRGKEAFQKLAPTMRPTSKPERHNAADASGS